MEKMVLIPKPFPNILIAKMIKTALIINTETPTGKPVVQNINVAIPLTPPPKISLGIKNAVQPRAMTKSPKVMIKYDRISLNIEFLFFICSKLVCKDKDMKIVSAKNLIIC